VQDPVTARGGAARIVVVDDAPFMRRRLRDVLEGAGYEVVAEAENGAQALERYAEHRPDLVTMDLVMPVMTGMEALAGLRAQDPAARVVVCSSISEQKSLLRAIALGARDYVLKPFDDEALLDAVRKALRDPAAAEGGRP
jgi:two-component system chemotaxis response regulator CheY